MLNIFKTAATEAENAKFKALGVRSDLSMAKWRCGECSSMQEPAAISYWVPNGVRPRDPLWSLCDSSFTQCTAWCWSCVKHWLLDSDVDKCIEMRAQRLVKADAELKEFQLNPPSRNQILGWDYEGWWHSSGKLDDELVKALASRPLTVDELQKVGRRGYDLLVRPMQSFNKGEKQAEFAALLLIQQLIQIAASRQPLAQPAAEDAVDPAEGSVTG